MSLITLYATQFHWRLTTLFYFLLCGKSLTWVLFSLYARSQNEMCSRRMTLGKWIWEGNGTRDTTLIFVVGRTVYTKGRSLSSTWKGVQAIYVLLIYFAAEGKLNNGRWKSCCSVEYRVDYSTIVLCSVLWNENRLNSYSTGTMTFVNSLNLSSPIDIDIISV